MYDFLCEWKGNPSRKCLIVRGQRQVGKTYIIREFGKTYSHFIELNFVEKPSHKQIFEGDLDVDSLISKMKLFFPDEDIVPGSTLLLFDEIQDCPAARTSLKFFTQDGRYDVIGSGSRLGVESQCDGAEQETDQAESVPVGYETSVEMKGLDFEEFLWATGISEEAIAETRRCIADYIPLPTAYLSVLESRFRDYLVVGGMPEAVQSFVDTSDYMESRKVILQLVESTKADINKYNHGVDRIKTTECYESMPHQLDQTNKKFMYSRISGEGSRKSAEKYMDNLLWIKSAGYGNFCYSLYGIAKPLERQKDLSSFRIYFSDTGTLVNLYGVNSIRAILASDYSYNLGAMAENAVSECLVKAGYRPMYYHSTSGKKRLEIDFLIEYADGIAAIEVKSGKGRSAPSINYLDSEVVTKKIMFRTGNIGDEPGDIRGYPLFAAAFIDSIVPMKVELPHSSFRCETI